MPVYKDEETGTWYVRCYVTSWDGKRYQRKKRGFATKKEAAKWENDIKAIDNSSIDISVNKFVEMYFEDKKGELKERSLKNKLHMIEKHILPYFGEKKINEIKTTDIIKWQNIIREKDYAETYQRMLQNQLNALFNHASKVYNLKENPCSKIKKMGKSDAKSIDFWTRDEYDKFIATFEENDRYYVLFEILFWTGCREGELLALNSKDIDLVNNKIHISKTYYRSGGKDYITEPKTESSVRTIDIPEFLKEEIQDYLNRLYKYPENERIFPIGAEAVQHMMKAHIKMAGVKKIRVHDLRHSHVAFLINQGVKPLVIKERVGHRDIKMTLNTYGHLYPNEQKDVAEMLNAIK